MMMKESMKEPKNSQEKETWKTPEVVDLNINEGTQNVTKIPGTSLNDGGDAFSDYNS